LKDKEKVKEIIAIVSRDYNFETLDHDEATEILNEIYKVCMK